MNNKTELRVLDMVSVIITTYKRSPEILQRALNSVLHQTYTNIEIIVVNDSPDYERCPDIDDLIKKVQKKKIRYIINEKSLGAPEARNIGLMNSIGDIVAFLDDDDEWYLNKLEKMVPHLINDIGLVYCDMNVINGKIMRKKKAEFYDRDNCFKKLLVKNFIGGYSTPIIKYQSIIDAGGLDMALPSSQDLDLWRRLAKVCSFKYLNETLIKYYVLDNSITTNSSNRINGCLKLLEKYRVDYIRYPKEKVKYQNFIVIDLIANKQIDKAKQLHKIFYNNKNFFNFQYFTCYYKGNKRIFLKSVKRRINSILYYVIKESF